MTGTLSDEERREMLERAWEAELDAVSRLTAGPLGPAAQKRVEELRKRLAKT